MKRLLTVTIAIATITVAGTDLPPSATAGAYAEMTVAVVETRPCDIADMTAKIDTLTPIGFTVTFR